MLKAEKIFFVDNFTEELKSASSVILVNYTGLTVKMQQDLKKRLSAVGANMTVAKNSLYSRSAKAAKLPDEAYADTVLAGPSAFVISEGDPIAPLQIIQKFAAEFEIPQFKVGIIDGKLQDKDTLQFLSKLPSKEVLYSQVAGAVAAPLYNLIGTLQGNLQKLVYILKEASHK